MPKGPNSWFLPPDSDFISNGTVVSADNATGMYSGVCTANSSNRGSLSAFMVGTPTAGTTLDFRIQNSGSAYTATYMYKKGSSDDSSAPLDVWYGEPDRRHMWDIHNPLVNNISDVNPASSSTEPTLNSAWTNESVVAVRGCYFSTNNTEYLYIARQQKSKPVLAVISRSIKNYEQTWSSPTDITTLYPVPSSQALGATRSEIDSNGRGLETQFDPLYDVCEHSDGKIKLAVKYNGDIDLYESSDGTTFTLIAKELLSRFVDKRHIQDVRIASSGPYLKIVYVLQVFYTAKGTSGGNNPNNYIGGISSADGGATWIHSEVAGVSGEGGDNIKALLVNGSFGSQNYGYDLCGLTDGSGRFILAASVNLDVTTNTPEEKGPYNPFFSGTDVNFIHFWISDGTGKLQLKEHMAVGNIGNTGKPYLASNNDWIWLIVGGDLNPIATNWKTLVNGFLGGKYTAEYLYQSGDISAPGQLWKSYTHENSMFYLKIDDDLNVENWKPLGNNDTVTHNTTNGERIFSGKSTGGLGSYFYIPSSGKFYSCGPYMSFSAIGNPVGMGYRDGDPKDEDLSNFFDYRHQLQYFRFSGWNLRPPWVNSGHNPQFDESYPEEVFRQQEFGVISQPEFNYIWGTPIGGGITGPTENESCWGKVRKGFDTWAISREDGFLFTESNIPAASSIYGKSRFFYYFKCPSVTNTPFWSTGDGQTDSGTTDYDYNFPKFPNTMTVIERDLPEYPWLFRPHGDYVFTNPNNPTALRHKAGSCIQFVFGGVINGSSSKNSIGVRINSYLKKPETFMAKDFTFWNFFLRMSSTKLSLYNTSADPSTSIYRETSTSLICEVEPSSGTYGATPFEDYWWECRLIFQPSYENPTTKTNVIISIRKIGTESWINSAITEINYIDGQQITGRPAEFFAFGTQEIAFGLFADSGGTSERSVQFRNLKVCQGSDMSQYYMLLDDGTNVLPPAKNIIRGRYVAPLPAHVENNQSISWGGIGGMENDQFSTSVDTSYSPENTIKTSSPRYEYRTLGSNTADIKSSTATIVYELKDSDRTTNSLDGYGLYHTGLAVLNTNAMSLKVEYSDTSDFASSYTVGNVDTLLNTGRVTAASNNKLSVTFNGESARNIRDSEYTSTDNNEYYLLFRLLSGGTGTAILQKSYKITKQRGDNLILDINDVDLSDAAYSTIAGTSIEIYSNQFALSYSQFPTYNKYLRLTFSNHMGTEPYIKVGSVVAGLTFGMERVPIQWEHNVSHTGNVNEFTSRSNVRWGYKEGPSVKSFTGTIMGDVFDQERRNILNITKHAMQYNVNPVVMVFDGGANRSTSAADDPNLKFYAHPENILLGTFSDTLELVNPGWRYDETLEEWKTVGDMELTILEVV